MKFAEFLTKSSFVEINFREDKNQLQPAKDHLYKSKYNLYDSNDYL